MSQNLHANNMYPNIFVVFYIKHSGKHIFNQYLNPGVLLLTIFKKKLYTLAESVLKII